MSTRTKCFCLQRQICALLLAFAQQYQLPFMTQFLFLPQHGVLLLLLFVVVVVVVVSVVVFVVVVWFLPQTGNALETSNNTVD
jgi:hypothetical protein